MDLCYSHLEHAGKKTINFYTHDFQWLEKDAWEELDIWLEKLAGLKASADVDICKLGAIGL
jgi:hypothetical protein